MEKPTATIEQHVFDSRNTKQDDAAMAEVGKVQQFKRGFGFWTILGLTASMMCTWEAGKDDISLYCSPRYMAKPQWSAAICADWNDAVH